MLTRIITGFFLFIAAGLWLFFPVASTESSRFLALDVFNMISGLIIAIGGWEFAKLVFLKPGESNGATPAPSGSSEDRNLLLKRFLYAAVIFLLAILSFKYVDHEVWTGSWARPAEVIRNLGISPLLGILAFGAFWWLGAMIMVFFYPRSGILMRFWWQRALAGVFTLIPFGVSLLLLRYTGISHYDEDPYIGSRILLSVMMLVWSADTGAYFQKNLGRACWRGAACSSGVRHFVLYRHVYRLLFRLCRSDSGSTAYGDIFSFRRSLRKHV